MKRFGMDPALVDQLSHALGISGICNIYGAIKTAKYYGFGKDDLVVTIATDGMDRYPSVMEAMRKKYGALDEVEAVARVRSLFHGLKTDWVFPGTPDNRAALAPPEVLHLGRAAGQDG